MRNLLTSFDEFAGSEILSERDFQDYLGRYQDLRDEWKSRKPGGEKEDITDDIVFEIELINRLRSILTTSCFWYRNTTIHTATIKKFSLRSRRQ